MFRFGPFRLDPHAPQLFHSGQPLKLERIPLEVLILLIRHRDSIVSREAIAEAVWGRDKFVEAADGINTAIRKIRRALDDTAGEPRYIGTVVGRGYRFLAEVEVEEDEEAASVSPALHQPTAPSHPHRPRLFILIAASVILAAGLAVWLGFRYRWPAEGNKSSGIVRLTADNGFTGWPDLSPDGKLIAYASNRADPDNIDLYIQPVAGGSAIRLTHEPGHDFFPSISPKGDSIAFASMREPKGIYVVPIFGGTARLVAKGGTRPRYSPDGEWIAFSKSDSSWIVPASGGEPRRLRPELSSGSPIWAGNDHLIFIAHNEKNAMDWWLTPRDGSWAKPLGVFPLLAKQPRQDFPDSWQSFRTPDYFDNGSVVFRVRTRDGANLWRIRFSPDWQPFPPERVTAMTDHVREPTVSANGHIAAAVVSRNIDVYELPLDADTATVRGEIRRLTTAKTSEQFASVTADGNLVSYTAWRKSDHGDQFLLDSRTGIERQLTATDEKEAHGRISPDGRFLIFGRWDAKGKSSFHRMTIASGETQHLCDDCEAVETTPDGASFTFNESPPKRLLLRDLSGGPVTEPVHDDSLLTTQASVAPGNRWIAFVALPHGDNEPAPKIFAAPFRRDGRLPKQHWTEVATGLTPLWSPNGQWIYFDDQHGSFRCLFARRFDPVAGKPTGQNVPIAHIHGDQQLIRSSQFKDRGLARNKIVFSTMEMLSNIWMLQ